MHSGLCLVKRKKPTDPDVNQQAAFAVEILVFRSDVRQKQISTGGTFLPAFPDLSRRLRRVAAVWLLSGEKDCSRRLCSYTGDCLS